MNGSTNRQLTTHRHNRLKYLNLTNAIFFFGLLLALDIYVTITLQMFRSPDATWNSALSSIQPQLFGNETNTMHHAYNMTNLNHEKTPSLAIVSVCIPGERFPQEYIDASHTNKLHYCQRYNASCILPSKKLSGNSKVHAKWDKLHHINEALQSQQTDWVLWMDCDAAFTNFEIHWYHHLKPYLNTSQLMIVSKDVSGFNLGVFLVPNTPPSRKFIQDLYKLRFQLDKKFFHKDQSALKHLVKSNPKLNQSFEIVPQELMNAYLDNDAGVPWTPYSWIVHQVFCRNVTGCMTNFTGVVKMVTPQLGVTQMSLNDTL